jgi:hypothetical protein
MRVIFALFVLLAVCVSAGLAQDAKSMSGEYACTYGCRPTDAPPTLRIDGEAAICTNELGGIFYGRLLDSRTISCFNKNGALAADGRTIHWDGGVVWTRVR